MTNSRIKLGITAMGISFMGTLPLGILNISIANLVFHHHVKGAISFALAAAAVEVLTVRLALILADRLHALKHYYGLFRFLSVAILFTFSMATFIAAYKTEQFNGAFPLTNSSPFIAGLTLSALNPLHIPFWMGWAAVLKNRGMLRNDKGTYNLFVVAIGIGTIIAFGLYGLAGRFLIQLLGHWQGVLNWIIGTVLLLISIIQLHKILSTSQKKKLHKTSVK